MAQNSFFPDHKSSPGARIQLICLHYAGGAAVVFRPWVSKLSPHIEVCAAELPGRGRRFRETPFQTLGALLPPLTESVRAVLDGRPFAFFGHSMGALLAYEVTRRLRQQGHALPAYLFLSARGVRSRTEPIHTLPDHQMIAKLHAYGGAPREVLENAELMELLLPTVRADFAIAVEHAGGENDPLPVPIEAMGGADDPFVSPADLAVWGTRTTSSFESTIFPGAHFYQREREAEVLELVASRLARFT